VVVICPKCKTKLKVNEAKLLPQGSRFKCPKCSTILVVKKPPAREKKALDKNKILVAHSKSGVAAEISSILKAQGYSVITSGDGIDAMVKALQEFPFLSIVEVVLPKIFGFEVCKRLKLRPETKEMKVILITSPHDKEKYRREPSSLYGADEYIEEHSIPSDLISKINSLNGIKEEMTDQIPEPPSKKPEPGPPEKEEAPSVKPGQPITAGITPSEDKPVDEGLEKAMRLSRTIINDIYLYNSAKVDESIKNNTFYSVFASELKEGQKLYETRIPQEVKNKGDFFNEVIEKFISDKRQKIS
jgi:predicted Zn finger-like uncharacterized protein